MGRVPSDKTIIRNQRSEIAVVRLDVARLKIERDQYRQRATKAEQEVAEWKTRFDALLRHEDPTGR